MPISESDAFDLLAYAYATGFEHDQHPCKALDRALFDLHTSQQDIEAAKNRIARCTDNVERYAAELRKILRDRLEDRQRVESLLLAPPGTGETP